MTAKKSTVPSLGSRQQQGESPAVQSGFNHSYEKSDDFRIQGEMSLSTRGGSEDEKAPLGHKIREAHRRGKPLFSKSKKAEAGSAP